MGTAEYASCMPSELVPKSESGLPPILAGNATPDIRQRVGQFFSSVASLFESWVTWRKSAHTQRAYREDIMSFVSFLGIEWPDQAAALRSVSVNDVLAFRELLLKKNAAPKTINRRISSLSSSYKYLAAAEIRLPITIPNPAHAQFISRESNTLLRPASLPVPCSGRASGQKVKSWLIGRWKLPACTCSFRVIWSACPAP